MGIDRHPYIPVVDYVLGRFQKEEQSLIEEGIENAVKAIQVYLDKGFHIAMNTFN